MKFVPYLEEVYTHVAVEASSAEGIRVQDTLSLEFVTYRRKLERQILSIQLAINIKLARTDDTGSDRPAAFETRTDRPSMQLQPDRSDDP